MSLLVACLFMCCQFAGAFGVPGSTSVSGAPPPPGTGFSTVGITVAGGNGPGAAPNQLNSPIGIFVEPAGTIYITDQQNSRIQKWGPGASTGVTVAGGNGAGSAPNQLNLPFDVFVDATGNIYIDEANGARVEKWAPGASSGTIVAGNNGRGSAPNQLNDPWSIYLDAANNIYISDQINSRVQKWAPGATTGTTVAGSSTGGSAANQLQITFGVFVDTAGNIYVCDAGNYRVQKWSPGATSGITVAGGNGRGSADNQVNPTDVFVVPAGNIFITDADNHRVQKWAPGATSGITVAGGNGQGSAPNQLNSPLGVFVDHAGSLYVSDYGNHRIQKFVADQSASCMPDLIFTVPSCTATVTIRWTEPRDTFPATIAIPQELDFTGGMLTCMGVLNRHGYYKSSFKYPWPVAKDISFYIGDTSVNGHLVTLTSAAENNFIFNQIRGSGYAPWIGLYNTGKPGQFGWVNGESSGYTNWAPGEPNNASGNTRYVKERYVRLLDSYGNWNDQRSDNAPFITEFDEPLIRYRQISGPANGSAQGTGVYRVCYESTNSITDQRDTCCFSITVTCTSPALTTAGVNSTPAIDKNSIAAIAGGLSITTSPNPTTNFFRLKVATTHHENSLDLTVTDVLGKVVETRKGIAPGQTIEVGANYRPGIYVAQVKQGNNKVMIKIIKQ